MRSFRVSYAGVLRNTSELYARYSDYVHALDVRRRANAVVETYAAQEETASLFQIDLATGLVVQAELKPQAKARCGLAGYTFSRSGGVA